MTATLPVPRHSDRIRPLDALRAIRGLLRNPDDTALVFEIIEGSRPDAPSVSTVPHHVVGRRPSRPPDCSRAPDAVAAACAGTLGRHYGDFMSREPSGGGPGRC